MTTLKERMMEVLAQYGEDFYTEQQLVWKSETEQYAYYDIIDPQDGSLINNLRVTKDYSKKFFQVHFLGLHDWIHTFDIKK